MVREGLGGQAFHAERTSGFDQVRAALLEVPAEDFARRAGVAFEDVTRVARVVARARTAAVRVDLGIQQSLHSTLNSYLEKLLFR